MSLLNKVFGLHRNCHYEEGIRLFDQGQYAEALNSFARSQEEQGRDHNDPLTSRLTTFYTAESHAHLGQMQMKTGQWECAVTHFIEAIKIHPHYADLHYQLAQAYRANGNPYEALQSLEHSLNINAKFAKALLLRGIINYEQQDHDIGIKSLKEAIVIEPAFQSESAERGFAYHELGDHLAAMQSFEQMSHTQVDDILFHYKLGDDLYRRGLYTDAVSEYQKALTLNADYADIRNHLGMAYNAQGLYQEGIEEFEQAIRINPRFVDAHLNLAITHRDNGRYEEAFRYFAQVQKLEPDNPIAQINLKELQSQLAA